MHLWEPVSPLEMCRISSKVAGPSPNTASWQGARYVLGICLNNGELQQKGSLTSVYTKSASGIFLSPIQLAVQSPPPEFLISLGSWTLNWYLGRAIATQWTLHALCKPQALNCESRGQLPCALKRAAEGEDGGSSLQAGVWQAHTSTLGSPSLPPQSEGWAGRGNGDHSLSGDSSVVEVIQVRGDEGLGWRKG